MKKRSRIVKRAGCLLLLVLAVLSACKRQDTSEENLNLISETAEEPDGGTLVLALVLTSRDAEENEELIERFSEEAAEAGAGFLVRFPDVSREEAAEAVKETGDFVLCDVNPIEYQMLIINELVAENVDVIAIHPNHGEALEPVLAAARSVGIRICAFGQEVGEESCDSCVPAEEAPSAAAALLSEDE